MASVDLELPQHEGDTERHIVIAIEHTDAGLHAVQWTLDHIYRKGDVIHVIHVANIKPPTTEIYHGVVGTSLRYRDLTLKDVHTEIEEIRSWLADEVVPIMKKAEAPYQLHLFVDKIGAPAQATAQLVADTSASVNGSILVLNKSNKTARDRFWMGSVATALTKLATVPITFVSST